jgi:hypothetical protein
MAQTPIHPGEHLKEELDTLDMSAVEFARDAIKGGASVVYASWWLKISHSHHK